MLGGELGRHELVEPYLPMFLADLQNPRRHILIITGGHTEPELLGINVNRLWPRAGAAGRIP